MQGIRKVLVGVSFVGSSDGSLGMELPPPTREAIDVALRMGVFSRAEVTFLSVWEQPEWLPDDDNSDQVSPLPLLQQILESLVAEADERGVAARARMLIGRAWMEIIREVLREGYDLVLVGTRNLRGPQRLLIGSTGMKLLRKCPCPVWVARPDPDPEVNTVLVADDLSDVGERCLHLGVAAAQMLDARLLVLHAVSYPLEWRLAQCETPPDEIKAYREKTRAEAERLMHERLAMTDFRTLARGTRVEVIAGPPDVVIQEVIAEHEVDLLVMGTLARTGIPGLLVGNTAERLLPAVPCSLLAIKPEEFQSPVPIE